MIAILYVAAFMAAGLYLYLIFLAWVDLSIYRAGQGSWAAPNDPARKKPLPGILGAIGEFLECGDSLDVAAAILDIASCRPGPEAAGDGGPGDTSPPRWHCPECGCRMVDSLLESFCPACQYASGFDWEVDS